MGLFGHVHDEPPVSHVYERLHGRLPQARQNLLARYGCRPLGGSELVLQMRRASQTRFAHVEEPSMTRDRLVLLLGPFFALRPCFTPSYTRAMLEKRVTL